MAILNQDTTVGGVNVYNAIMGGGKVYGPVTTTGTGAAYVATIEDGPESLYTGLLLVIILHTEGTSTIPKLNVNSLGAKSIYLYSDTGYTNAVAPGSASYYAQNKPLLLMYDGSYFRLLNYNEASWSNINSKPSSFTPSSHATANATTYGGGTATNYGHVKLSDSYTASQGSAADSVAASSSAVSDVYTNLSEKLFGNYADGRFTTWASIPAESGWFRIYDTSLTSGSTGQPTTAGSDYWSVLQLLSAYNSQTTKPTTNRYFIRFAFNMSNNTSATNYDMYYQKCYHNGSTWSNGSWYRIWNEYNDSQSPFLMNNTADSTSSTLRTTGTVTNSSTTGYFRNIKVGTSAPSTLTSGEIFLVYEP